MKGRDALTVGVDVGAAHVRAAVIDAQGHILGQEKHRLLSKEPPQVAEAILRAAKTACGAAGLPFSEVRAMGLGVAGQVERDGSVVLSAPGLGWRDVALYKLLQARAPRLPLSIATEISAAAWGERTTGAAKGVDDVVVVLAGANVCAAIVMGGKLQQGATGAAGELGHVKVHPAGRQCACTQRGCLDAYASATSLAAWARDDLRIAAAAARASGKPPVLGRRLLDLVGGDPERITASAMDRAAHEGDELSTRLLDEAARMLGLAVANLVTAVNPAWLLLGGGLLSSSPRMRRTVQESVEQHLGKAARAALRIGSPALGDDASVVGAALMARQALVV